MQALNSSRSSVLEPQRSKAPADLHAKRKQELGQFLTPETIGSFMASLFEAHSAEIRLLDAGAGDGALTAAFVKRMCGSRLRPKRISATAYELDEAIVDALERTLRSCRVECNRSGIEFSAELHSGDFIETAVSLVRGDLFRASRTPFNAAILNPPYRKINSDSHIMNVKQQRQVQEADRHDPR